MQVWHPTPDADREPKRVPPGVPVRLRIGTWPIEPGQEVTVEYRATPWAGAATAGRVQSSWIENRGANSYWSATLGPFAERDLVDYRVVGTAAGETAATDWSSFTVRPSSHLALLWHHHQPVYRDFLATRGAAFRFPWVRLHAVRDYYGMAALLAAHPGVHATINFSPVLLRQLDDYVERGAEDRALALTRKAASRLSAKERDEVVSTFFDAHWHHQIYPHPRYRALLDQRVQGKPFSAQDVTDLKMWFNLAWFAIEFRTGSVELPDGSRVSVQRFIEQGEGFSQQDIDAMLEEQWKVLAAIVPLHRMLQERGQIEVSMSPYAHPILPLLIDSDQATLDRPGTSLPPRFCHPEDAEAHVAAAVADYRKRFGRALRGMWPSEGAVSEAALPPFARHGVRWIATDEGVLARSGRYGYRVDDPGVLCQPYQALSPGGDGELAMFFRSRTLSDAIGFHYQDIAVPEDAARHFFDGVKAMSCALKGERDYVVSVILDGENAWGSYPDDGRPFLHALYGALAADPAIKTVTMSEYLDGNASRQLPPHPTAEQTRVYSLFTGSWIDEPGSLPGVDLGTWIGEDEENAAWALLGDVRRALEEHGADPVSTPAAFQALYAAEGSDWFWWLGTDHESDADEAFDDLFRNHLRAACRAANIEPPAALDRHLVPHRVVWTFTAPVEAIQPRDQLVIRTNCPGVLALTRDAWVTTSHLQMTACGGVMAGPSHYTVVLGPYPAETVLAFRFQCECPTCTCDAAAPCCRGDEWTVRVRGA